jgi:hypothetical protein
MGAFIYRCPNTGYLIQGVTSEEVPDDNGHVPITCDLCRRIHLVNPMTGEVLGAKNE